MANYDLVASPARFDVTRPYMFKNIFCYKKLVKTETSTIYFNCRLLETVIDQNGVCTIFDIIVIKNELDN